MARFARSGLSMLPFLIFSCSMISFAYRTSINSRFLVSNKKNINSVTSAALSSTRQPGHFRLKAEQQDNNKATNNNFYITTPIYYVNGEPHLGHAYTSVLSDIIARYHRKDGKSVYFLSGTDEHGQKVEQSATIAEKTPIEFADFVSAKFRTLMQELQCSNDDFIRTTEIRHKLAVQHLWKVLEEKNQIYLGAYEGWYSIRDEAFYGENELINGKAPTGAEVTWVKEESYFFRLSAWTEKLLAFYETNPDFIGPKGRRNEVLSFVSQEGGLKDLSISRTTFAWGIPVPGNDRHVIYVWLDALVNYISALQYPDTQAVLYNQYWPASVHVVGKDILRFHAVFWPAFLMAADLPLPQKIFAHGWWTKDGEKMSKSLGNVLNPHELLQQYGTDYVRYFLASEIYFGNDGDFSHESFRNKINSELANDLGNLAQRVLTLVHKHCDGCIPTPNTFTAEDEVLLKSARNTLHDIRNHLEQLNIKAICEATVLLAKQGNRYIDQAAPWDLCKKSELRPRLQTVLYVLMEVLRLSAVYIEPVIPTAGRRMLDMLGIPEDMRTFASASIPLTPGLQTQKPVPLFPRLEAPEEDKAVVVPAPRKEKAPKNKSNNELDANMEQKYAAALQSAEGMTAEIGNVGDKVRQLKADKVEKAVLTPILAELKFLKDRYKAATGVDYMPAKSISSQ